MSDPWIYSCHRFASREEFEAAFAGWDASLRDVAHDVIGTIYEATGETALDPVTGETLEIQAPIPGFHVNVAIRDGIDLPEAFQQSEIHPHTPYRVWA